MADPSRRSLLRGFLALPVAVKFARPAGYCVVDGLVCVTGRDGAAIQAAIDYASAQPPWIIFLPAGTYRISGSIRG